MPGMIADPTLHELFRSESEEHLQHLDEAFLQLEKTPSDRPLIEEAFREAHSLKGAARMLGLSAIMNLAHRLEDTLNSARRGSGIEPGAVVRMAQELGELRVRVAEALGEPVPTASTARTGPAQHSTPTPTEAFDPVSPPTASSPAGPAPAGLPPAAVAPDISPPWPTSNVPVLDALKPAGDFVAPSAPVETPETAVAPATPTSPYRIDSVRVGTQRLDALMRHAGELTAAHTRFARRLEDFDALLERLGGCRLEPALAEAVAAWRGAHAEDVSRLEGLADALDDAVRGIRLLPVSNLFRLFPRMVRDLAAEQRKAVEFSLEGEDTAADKRILEEMKDPLMHLLRNAIDHGIEAPEVREQAGKPRTARLVLSARHQGDGICLEVRDDGRGFDLDALRKGAIERGAYSEAAVAAMNEAQVHALALLPGVSTARFVTDLSGRGVGMDVVRANVERLKGEVRIDSTPGAGTRVRLRLPGSLATLRVMLVEVGGHPYGLPTEAVAFCRNVTERDLFEQEGRLVLNHAGRTLRVANLAELLELRGLAGAHGELERARPCVFLTSGETVFGVFVDALLDEVELVLKPAHPLLPAVRNVLGAAILNSGEICLALNPHDLLRSLGRSSGEGPAGPLPAAASVGAGAGPAREKARPAILLVEDSITTRTQEKRILEAAGYAVTPCGDGLEAFRVLTTADFAAVVSDINMPRMDGLELAERIRRIPRFAKLPIVLVTSLATDEDRQRGLEIGASAYITKPEFDQTVLLETLERLVGAA